LSRRYRRRPDLDSPWAWVVLLGWVFIVAIVLALLALAVVAWLLWALIALPIAGIAKLAHNESLSRKMIRSLAWAGKRKTAA
jgi:hypothetical protein